MFPTRLFRSLLIAGSLTGGLDAQEIRRVLPGNKSALRSLAFSPDGTHIASGCLNGEIRIFDITLARNEKAKEPRTLKDHDGRVFSLAYSPDGKQLASGGLDGVVRIWNTQTFRPESKLDLKQGVIRSIAFSPNGGLLAVGAQNGRLLVFNAATLKEVISLQCDNRWLCSVAFDRDGKRIVTSGGQGDIAVWDCRTGESKARVKCCPGAVFFSAFQKVGHEVLAVTELNALVVCANIQTADSQLLSEKRGLKALSGHMVSSGRILGVGYSNGFISLFNLETKQVAKSFRSNGVFEVNSIAISPDENFLAEGSRNGEITLWNIGDIAELWPKAK